MIETVGGVLTAQATYVYDVNGNRIEEDDYSGGVTTVTRFGYDGDNVWADLNGSNALVTEYVRPDGTDALGARVSAAGAVAWYNTDRQGSVRALTDDTGAVQDTLNYSAYGVVSESNAAFGDRYKYTGREWDGVSQLQYNRDRYYDPQTATWTTQDPTGFNAGDDDLYRYVGNGPTNGTDPTGQSILVPNDSGAPVRSRTSSASCSSTTTPRPPATSRAQPDIDFSRSWGFLSSYYTMKPASREYADPILGYLGQVIGPRATSKPRLHRRQHPAADLPAGKPDHRPGGQPLQDAGDKLDLRTGNTRTSPTSSSRTPNSSRTSKSSRTTSRTCTGGADRLPAASALGTSGGKLINGLPLRRRGRWPATCSSGLGGGFKQYLGDDAGKFFSNVKDKFLSWLFDGNKSLLDGVSGAPPSSTPNTWRGLPSTWSPR